MAKNDKKSENAETMLPGEVNSVNPADEAARLEAQVRVEEAELRLAEIRARKAELDAAHPTQGLARDDKKAEVPPGHFRNKRGLIVDEKYRGVKKYRATKERYSGGHFFKPGDIVTLEDEMPSKHYVPVTVSKKKAAPVEEIEDVEERDADQAI